ncbi:hypothetical protein CPA40_08005 [Bifidobacterium callitrichos]|uniref:FAD/NAD(P)-binding domain-containing protein n=1 Tax=Bifidobacterium callitrichos TaxID=762209 RepID=A0A2T3G982_9BIFI|nr:FAD-dependent oxidoreductase [Bifidobacterium callitrichos]PST46012.1 hypothetical protein CPA40_08005 [Bifidobacterium callitrichos]
MSENKDAASVPLSVLSPTGVAGDNTEGDLYDAVIIGGGPAGLSAAIYMTRAGYRTLVVEAGSYGGQITLTSEVRNYPGIERATGQWLAESMHRRAGARTRVHLRRAGGREVHAPSEDRRPVRHGARSGWLITRRGVGR